MLGNRRASANLLLTGIDALPCVPHTGSVGISLNVSFFLCCRMEGHGFIGSSDTCSIILSRIIG